MNEKNFEEAVRTTLKELCSMSREEFHVEMDKRKNSDFARIFSEANESDDDYPVQVNQRNINSYQLEEKLEKLFSEVVERQLKKFLPVVVEEVLSRVEQRV
jgi:hypothetical protein